MSRFESNQAESKSHYEDLIKSDKARYRISLFWNHDIDRLGLKRRASSRM